MQKLQALVEYILSSTGVPREQVHAFADQGVIQPTGKHLGLVRSEIGTEQTPPREQLQIGIWQYEGVIQVERYAGSGMELLALVVGWVADNDIDRSTQDRKDPTVDIDINDAITSDIEISVEFEEPLVIIENPKGNITFRGKLWSVHTAVIVEAQSIVNMVAGHEQQS